MGLGLWPETEEGLVPAQLFAAQTDRPVYAGTLRDYITIVNPKFRWYKHVEALAEALEAIVAGDLTRLMVFEPPRHGKSLLASRLFPGYYLAKRPDKWVGLCSYEATLAQDFSRSARDGYLRVGGHTRTDSSAVHLWQSTDGGGMWAAGVGGPITGRGADLGLIDDPLKNAEEAASETIRTKHKSWYDSTFYTRLEPNAAQVITQTRWNEDDLSGYLLAKEAEEPEHWHVINLEAIKAHVQVSVPESCTLAPDWRQPGEALCPERYDATQLGKIQRRIGSYYWAALYQQRPAPLEGGMLKRSWWKYYTVQPAVEEFDYLLQSWDMSFKDSIGTDFVVGQVWGRKGSRAYLLDQVKDRMDFPTTVEAVKQLSATWPATRLKLVEDKANGSAVIASLSDKLPGLVPVEPDGGKIARAAGCSPLIEAGNVYLPDPSIAPWVGGLVGEASAFPNGAHDDQVDALTQALNRIYPGARDPKPIKEVPDHKQPNKAAPLIVKDGKLIKPDKPPQTIEELVDWAARRQNGHGRLPHIQRSPTRR